MIILNPPPVQCPDDSRFDKRSQQCVCIPPRTGKPGACQVQLQILRTPPANLPVIK